MVTYEQYIERFRNWQLEKDERLFYQPMSEEHFKEWIKPIQERDFSRTEKLSYKEIYLRLRKLFIGNEEAQKQLDEIYMPLAKDWNLI